MKKRLLCVLSSLVFFLSPTLNADSFPFTPPPNFVLNPQLIKLRHPVTTDNTIAQLYFNQGLTLLYAFNHDASYWSFYRAAQEDPNMAMAYWGMALAIGQNINMDITEKRQERAYQFIQKAIELSDKVTPQEKAYIQALSKRYSNAEKPDLKKLARDYNQAMKELKDTYKEDLDAATLYAESILDLSPWDQWTPEGEPKAGTLEAIAVLESVLKRNPMHIGANHYYIHVVEAGNHPEWALVCADRLRTMMPASGHLIHMPSHIYILVGDYHQAALSNEAAVDADRQYAQQFGVGGVYIMHYLTHNYYFLSRAYALEGRYADAKHAAEQLADLYIPHFEHDPTLEYYATAPYFNAVKFHNWNDVLTYREPSTNMKQAHMLWRWSRAYAYYHLGQYDKAHQEQELYAKEAQELPADSQFGLNPAKKIINIANALLEAWQAREKKDKEAAIAAYKKAIAEQDTMRYNEPPDWYFPVREAFGAYLLTVNEPQQAEEIFRADLVKHPRNGRGLYGLMEALKQQKKDYEYWWVAQEFNKAWYFSDTSLTPDKI